jgi:hypothetical protein
MRFSKRIVLQSLTVIAAGIAIGLTVSATSAYASLRGEASPQGFCGDCHTATIFGASSHDFHGSCMYSSGYRPEPNTCHQDDASGGCSAHHNNCNVEEEFTIESVAQLAREGSVRQLSYLISKYGGRVSFNENRRSVQVLDCDGHVAANLPVTEDVGQALALSN